MNLEPLPPTSLSFPTAQGEGRNDYFFAEAPRRGDAAFRAALRVAVDAAHARIGGARAVHSIYVYERTAVLNAGFTGAASDLKGVHDGELVSYSRWTAGTADIFYVIDGGQVVFDLLKNAPVEPPFEFD